MARSTTEISMKDLDIPDDIMSALMEGKIGRTYKKSKQQAIKEATTPNRRTSTYYQRNRVKILARLAAGARREQRLKLKYGLSLEAYNELLKRQNNSCAICESPHAGRNGWCVDHCHETNVTRGLLCTHCNTMLGLARDDPKILDSAALYIRSCGMRLRSIP